jgi:putative salt-induced outer membrane protein
MQGRKYPGVVLVALCAASAPALADWTAKGELGASFASGNSENESANAALEVKNTRDKWTHTLGLAGNYGSDGTVTTAERWEVRGQSDYAFTDRAYWFGAGRYEDDRFSAFEYQASLSTGPGYKFINTERTKLWAQAGPGYRFAEVRETGEARTASSSGAMSDSNTSSPIRPRSSIGSWWKAARTTPTCRTTSGSR